MGSSDRGGHQSRVAAQNGHLLALTEEPTNGILNGQIFRMPFQFDEECQPSGVSCLRVTLDLGDLDFQFRQKTESFEQGLGVH